MARDYGPRRNAKRAADKRRQAAPPAAMPGWIWLLVGVAIGVTVAAVIWILRPAGSEPAPRPVASAPAAGERTSRRIELPPEKPSRFSFYELLPSYEVPVPIESTTPGQGRRGAAGLPEPGEYVLQVASFRQRDEAEAQRAQLALIGVEARVESVVIDGSQTWYRVRVGPLTEPARVQETIGRLHQHGFDDVMLMRVRGG